MSTAPIRTAPDRAPDAVPRILFIGDSHVRFWNGRNTIDESPSVFAGVEAVWVGAATAHNLTNAASATQAGGLVRAYLRRFGARYACVVLSFGEIDCRVHILAAAARSGEALEAAVARTVAHYLAFVDALQAEFSCPVVLWAPAPPGTPIESGYDPARARIGTVAERAWVTRLFEQHLMAACAGRPALAVASVFDQVIGPDWQPLPGTHFDGVHLDSRLLAAAEQALRRALAALGLTQALPALERRPPVAPRPLLRNVAAGLRYDLSSAAVGIPVLPFTDDPGSAGHHAFHTERQHYPWIAFDFQTTHLLREIVVYNRDDICQERARSLAIEASVNGYDFTLLYAPETSDFTGTTGGAPLRVTLDDRRPFRYLRLFLRANEYFHLQSVQVYALSFLADPGRTAADMGSP